MEFAWRSRPRVSEALDVDDERVITFPKGLLGFPEHHAVRADPGRRRRTTSSGCSRSTSPTSRSSSPIPRIFFKDYEVPIREEVREEIELDESPTPQVFVICNKVGEWLTGNLLGPMVVNAANRTGDSRWC